MGLGQFQTNFFRLVLSSSRCRHVFYYAALIVLIVLIFTYTLKLNSFSPHSSATLLEVVSRYPPREIGDSVSDTSDTKPHHAVEPSGSNAENDTPKNSASNALKKMKRILFWTTYFGWKDFRFGIGHEPFVAAGCRVTNCITTTDLNLVNESDALVFHPIDYDSNKLPFYRLPHQRYIFLFYEAATESRELPIFRHAPPGYFNWTMTYRRDSDIHSTQPYGLLLRLNNSTPMPNKLPPVALKSGELPPYPASLLEKRGSYLSLVKKKTKKVAWFVSHCKTSSQRENFVFELNKHIHVDVYGECGYLKCYPWNGLECEKILSDYKFYISAENSFCPDYVTEKFYRALGTSVVPIVYGGADYSAYAPPHSVIHAADFSSPKALADYMKLLDENPALYLKYFDWKSDWQVVRRPFDGWCDLCEKLNNPDEEIKSYKNLSKWWFDDIPCLTNTQLFNNTNN